MSSFSNVGSFLHEKRVYIDTDEEDTILVNFDADGGKYQNPHHWPTSQKWSVVVLNTINLFLMNLSVTVVAPALDVISRDLGMDPTLEGPLVMSTFILTLSLGPLLLAPLSELYGRVPLMFMGNVIFIIFNLACGFVGTKAELMACRILSGLGGGAAPVVSVAMIGDCFINESRGKPVAAANAAFILATPIGAILGALSTEFNSWRVSFYITTGIVGLTTFISIFVYRESYAPVILARKKKLLLKQNPNKPYESPYDDLHPTVSEMYYKTLIRPLHMLATQPVLQAIALYVAYTYGMTYLIFATFPALWEQHYGEPKSFASMHYLAAGFGFFVGIVICIFFADRLYLALKQRNNDIEKPEFQVPLLVIPAVFLPIGLFCYGWTTEYKVHWIIPSASIAVVMFGCTIVFQSTTAYMMEAFTLYSASVSAAAYLCRGISGFLLPLFGPLMYERLGYGSVGSMLAFLSLAFSWTVPLMLWFCGERLRMRSSFATRTIRAQ